MFAGVLLEETGLSSSSEDDGVVAPFLVSVQKVFASHFGVEDAVGNKVCLCMFVFTVIKGRKEGK